MTRQPYITDAQWRRLAETIQVGESVLICAPSGVNQTDWERARTLEAILAGCGKRAIRKKTDVGYFVTVVGVRAGHRWASLIPVCEPCSKGLHNKCAKGHRYSVKRAPVECGCLHQRVPIPGRP